MNWILNITSSTPVDRDPLFFNANLLNNNIDSIKTTTLSTSLNTQRRKRRIRSIQTFPVRFKPRDRCTNCWTIQCCF